MLGMGGVALLPNFGHSHISSYHMNEGHSALLTLALIEQQMEGRDLSSVTEEDLHAVVVYLRHLPRVRRQIPDPVPGDAVDVPGALTADHAFKNYDVDSSRK